MTKGRPASGRGPSPPIGAGAGIWPPFESTRCTGPVMSREPFQAQKLNYNLGLRSSDPGHGPGYDGRPIGVRPSSDPVPKHVDVTKLF